MRGQDLKLLLVKSGGICAFPTCGRHLTLDSDCIEGDLFVGQVAHIVGDSPAGPRGEHPLPLAERDFYDNLVLLCRDHHFLVDSQPATYTVERLRGIKLAHEEAIRRSLDHFRAGSLPPETKVETLHSTLLPVSQMPHIVYGADCALNRDSDVRPLVSQPEWPEMTPFILREGRIYTFHDLSEPNGPFSRLVEERVVTAERTSDWWNDPVRNAWFRDLARSALNKLTGRKGLHLDKEHRRYYFIPNSPGEEKSVKYRTLNGRRSNRKVVWQPTSRRTGIGRGYWYHFALSMRFVYAGKSAWYLTLRPEYRVTKDGETSIPPEKVGSKVTRKLARTFNYDLLGELHFWRDFLSGSRPQIVLPFGRQRIAISSTLLSGEVSWPGIPPEFSKSFKNVSYSEDMFDLLERLQQEADDGDWDEDEDDESDED